MRKGSDIGTEIAGEGWEPVFKFPQFQEDVGCSFRTAAVFSCEASFIFRNLTD